MSAKERVMCPECFGTGEAYPPEAGEAECSRCHGIGSVLVESNKLGTSEREDMEGKLKKLRESNEALLAENMALMRRCQEQEHDLQRLRGRLEMVYLIFGGKPNE